MHAPFVLSRLKLQAMQGRVPKHTKHLTVIDVTQVGIHVMPKSAEARDEPAAMFKEIIDLGTQFHCAIRFSDHTESYVYFFPPFIGETKHSKAKGKS